MPPNFRPALVACALGCAAPASSGDVTFYGELNPTLLIADDGVRDTDMLGDSSADPSRIGLYIHNKFGDIDARFNFETALGLRRTGTKTQFNSPSMVDLDRDMIRKVDLRLRGSFGTVSVGQGNMASDGITSVDLSGTKPAAYVSVGTPAAGIRFTDAVSGAVSNVSIGSAFRSYDGERLMRLRYDSGREDGFSISFSVGTEVIDDDDDMTSRDLTLRYQGERAGIAYRAALGLIHSDRPGAASERDTVGSFSAIDAGGRSLTVAMGARRNAGNYGYVKLGYVTDIWALGSTAVSVDYYNGDDIRAAQTSSRSVGLALVQNVAKADLDLSLAVRSYDFSEAGGRQFRRAETITLGASWKF